MRSALRRSFPLMNSPHQREQLPDLLSDALDATERARVESHLRECAQCARELRALQSMQSALATLPVAPAPDELRGNVRAAIRANKKQNWALPTLASLQKRAQKSLAPSSDWRQVKGSESSRSAPTQPFALPLGDARSQQRKALALPFALPTGNARRLAWGGAAMLSAVGLMLLARPSIQDDRYSGSAPVSEAELADRADNAPIGIAPPSSHDVENTTKRASTATNALTPNAGTPNAGTPNVTVAPGAKTASGTAQSEDSSSFVLPAPGTSAQLPPLPPPPKAQKRSVQPENMAPIPRLETPSFDLLPPPPKTPPRTSGGESRPVAPNPIPSTQKKPPASKPQSAPSKPAAPKMPAAPDKASSRPGVVAPSLVAPISPPSADASNRPLRDNSSDNGAPNDEERSDKENSFVSGPSGPMSDSAAPVGRQRVAPVPAPLPQARAFEAPPASQSESAKTSAQNSDGWTGGKIDAALTRGGGRALARPNATAEASKSGPLTLTFGVNKAIGNARLLLKAPTGEVQVWRGSLNALPVQIELSSQIVAKAKLRSGQTIRARLEQIDSYGNPKSSSTFDLLVP